MRSTERLCAGLLLTAAGAMAASAQATPGKPADAGSAKVQAAPAAQPAQQTQQEQQQQPVEARAARAGVSSDATVRIYPIQHTRAADLHRILESVTQAIGPMRVTTDERTNSLVVAGDEKSVLPKIAALVAALDQPSAKEERHAETVINVPLADARAKSVRSALEQLLSESPQRMPGMPPLTRVVADENGNSIWLAGEKSRVEQYAEYARQMDKGSASRPNPRRELRYYTLKNADARALGQTVGQTSAVMGLEVPIVADGASDTVIAFATKEEHEIIADLVSKLDVAPRRGKIVEEAAPESKKAESKKPEPKP